MKTINPHITLLVFLFLAGFCSQPAKAQTTVLSADPRGNPNAIYVVYSAAMDAASATAVENYRLTNTITGTGIPIAGATLDSDQVTVQLNLGASLQFTNNYTLTINNVKDSALNFISPNPTTINFWYGGNPNAATYTFDDGLVPSGTWLSSNALDTAGNGRNPYLSVSHVGGVDNSGMLILSAVTGSTHWLAPTNARADVPAGQAFGQWHIGDLAFGQPITNLIVAFDLFYGNGSGGNAGTNLMTDASHEGGNGFLFHWGPGLDPNGVDQYSGGSSSWGQGLDVVWRLYNSPPNTPGINIQYGGTAGPGANVPIATNAFLDYFTGNLTNTWPGYTNDPTQIGFSTNYTHVVITINVTNSPTITNAILSVTCSNAWVGVTNIDFISLAGADLGTNLLIPNFTMPRANQPMAFTSTDGAGAHSDCFLDNVDFVINGVHVTTPVAVGPVGIAVQPASQTVPENVYASFNVGVTGAPPYFYQWYSNNVPIAGATNASYTTPLTLYSNPPPEGGLAMGGNVVYWVAVSNLFSSTISSNAILTITRDTNGIEALSAGSVDGRSVDVLFSGYVDVASAGNPANYQVNGGTASILSATVRTNIANYGDPVFNYKPSYLTTVTLTLGTSISGAFQVTVGPGVFSRTGIPVGQTNLVGVVAGLTGADLGFPGSDPLATGETFAGAANLMEVVAGGSDIMAIGSSNPDHGHWAYLQQDGNFDVVADLVWETPTANHAKSGIMIRSASSDALSPAISEVVFPAAPAGANTYETAARTNEGGNVISWGAGSVPLNGHVPANWTGSAPTYGNNWIRIRRVGPYFSGFASPDGINWTLIGSITADTNNFPPTEFVGLVASAGNNDGRYSEADFRNFGPLAFPGAVVSITQNLPTNVVAAQDAPFPLVFAAKAVGGTALSSDLVYQWQRAEPGSPTVFNNIWDGSGNTNLYVTPVLSIANDNGAKYRCIAWVGDISTGHSVTSAVVTLSVIVDTNPPYMTGASADSSFTHVVINFNKGMDPNSLQNPANYNLAFGNTNLAVCAAMATANPFGLYTNVVLTICNPLSPGVEYHLTVTNLLDLAGNTINNTTVPGGRSRVVTGWMLVRGYLKYERWDGPSYPNGAGPYNGDVTNLIGNPRFHYNPYGGSPAQYFTPDFPDQVELITYSGYPNGDITNSGVNLFDFGARISGLVTPPVNGSYTFYIRGNDGTAMFASTDDRRENEIFVADANIGYAAPGPTWAFGTTYTSDLFGWIGFADSTPVTMTSGQYYYVEALEQQGNGTSWLEFTWGNPYPIGFDNSTLVNTDYASQTDANTLTNAAGGAWPVGTAPANGGAPTNAWNISGTNIAIYADPDLSSIVAMGLSNVTVLAGNSVTLSIKATAVLNLGTASESEAVVLPASALRYQWYSNNVAIVGATNAAYRTPVFTFYSAPETNFNYSVAVSAASPVETIPFLTLVTNAIVTELPNPPAVISASSFGGNNIGILFNREMDPITADNPTNYTVVGCPGTTVTGAKLLSDGKTVRLSLNGTLCGSTFTVHINNVQDTAGEVIAADTSASGNVLYPQLTVSDIGVATNTSPLEPYVVQTNSALTNVTFNLNYPGIAVMVTDGVFQVQASGLNVGNNQDGMTYLYERRIGDFDVGVRVDGLTVADALSRAGLMLRQNLTPGSPNYSIVADPPSMPAMDGTGNGQNKIEVNYRSMQDGPTTIWPNNPTPPALGPASAATQIPGIWLRLKLVGNKLYALTSGDGTNWALVARDTLSVNWPRTNLVGLCVSSRTNSLYTMAIFSHFGDTAMPTNKQALLLVGSDANVPPGSPNAPLQTSDTFAYNTLLALGFNVTVEANPTAQAEDGEGKSIVLWSSTGTSTDLGSPLSRMANVAVPLVTWENGAPQKLNLASAGGGTISSATINFVNTQGSSAIYNDLSLGLSGVTTVFNSAQAQCYSPLSAQAAGMTVIALASGNANDAVFTACQKGDTLTGANGGPLTAPHRRVMIFLDDNSPANLNTTGYQLFTNAILWAEATDAPTIQMPPASQAVAVGHSALFLVTAVGPGPYTYQWLSNNVSISGADARDYTTPPAALANDGDQYKVVVTGMYGSVTSAVATLTVQAPISITDQPQNVTQLTGSPATFRVTATGSAPVYQWYSNNVVIAGATNASYTTPPVTLANNGDLYKVSVSNLVSSVTSSNAILTVLPAAPEFGAPRLANGQLVLTWSNGGTLLTSTNVALPLTNWTAVPGATSPYTNSMTNSAVFFILKQ